MNLVIIESPYGTRPDGSRASVMELCDHLEYARRALYDSLQRGEAPYASHLLYTQVLKDDVPEERRAGMQAGFAWGRAAVICAVYADYEITPGMREGIECHEGHGLVIDRRTIGRNP